MEPKRCGTVKGCDTDATHYVLDAAPGGWSLWACEAHVSKAVGMFPSSIVYDERQRPTG